MPFSNELRGSEVNALGLQPRLALTLEMVGGHLVGVYD